ncbi:MAG: acylphosphatase [Verrucomicrobiota bacterium JB022]|nr:acylphosphatase [Verrucomicrobiota bacterium JB022]
MAAEITHLQARFHGRVQGVGFRFYTLQLAKGYAVSGYVRNEPDGTVAMEVEGEDGEVRRFLADLRERMAAFVRQCDERYQRREPQFSGFNLG